MRARIIEVTRQERLGTKLRRPRPVDQEPLTVGRGTDNALPLNDLTIALHHGAFHLRSGEIHLEALSALPFLVNGHPTLGARVRPGDAVRAGNFELRLIEPGPDADLALEVEELEGRESDREDLARRTRIGVGRRVGRRGLASSLVLAVLGLFLALPLGARRLLESWSPGPISPNHEMVAADCEACHAVPFAHVRDKECAECHRDTGAHVPKSAPSAAHALFEGSRCGACHVEHRGAHALVSFEQEACGACHADLDARVPEAQVKDASDFGSNHPQLSLTLLFRDERAHEWRAERTEWKPGLEERSGLLFDHLRHVGQVVTDGREERNMQCGECHVLSPDGLHHQPIEFERHCEACHTLTVRLDPTLSERRALHGDPARMRDDLRGFFASLALGGDPPASAPTSVRRARPGSALSPAERKAALAWVDEQVARVSTFLLAEPPPPAERTRVTQCGECHLLVPRGASDGGTGVQPARLQSAWMPDAAFSHRTHAPAAACGACHPAVAVYDEGFAPRHPRPAWSLARAGELALRTIDELRNERGLTPSEKASDVNLPEIADCRRCHAGERAVGPSQVASPCVLCHPFHRPLAEAGPMHAVADPK